MDPLPCFSRLTLDRDDILWAQPNPLSSPSNEALLLWVVEMAAPEVDGIKVLVDEPMQEGALWSYDPNPWSK